MILAGSAPLCPLRNRGWLGCVLCMAGGAEERSTAMHSTEERASSLATRGQLGLLQFIHSITIFTH
jgi:hypothetical protein